MHALAFASVLAIDNKHCADCIRCFNAVRSRIDCFWYGGQLVNSVRMGTTKEDKKDKEDIESATIVTAEERLITSTFVMIEPLHIGARDCDGEYASCGWQRPEKRPLLSNFYFIA